MKEIGYEAVRADEIAEPGSITSQIMQRIFDDDLVVADLTDHNPNVFYELSVSPNPPMDTDGRREDTGRRVRKLHKRWSGLEFG